MESAAALNRPAAPVRDGGRKQTANLRCSGRDGDGSVLLLLLLLMMMRMLHPCRHIQEGHLVGKCTKTYEQQWRGRN